MLGATLFNLITDLVGGVRLTVLEEEVVERTASPMRRFVVRRSDDRAADPAATVAPSAARVAGLPGSAVPGDSLSRPVACSVARARGYSSVG